MSATFFNEYEECTYVWNNLPDFNDMWWAQLGENLHFPPIVGRDNLVGGGFLKYIFNTKVTPNIALLSQ